MTEGNLLYEQFFKGHAIASEGVKINHMVDAIYGGPIRVLPEKPLGFGTQFKL